jgi:hypothetical protein
MTLEELAHEHGINGLQETWVHELLEIAGHGESFLSGKYCSSYVLTPTGQSSRWAWDGFQEA